MRQRLDVVCGFVFAFMGIFCCLRVASESIIQFATMYMLLNYILDIFSLKQQKSINHSVLDVNANQMTRELCNTTEKDV